MKVVKIKCSEIKRITPKCYLLKDYNGNEDLYPFSQIIEEEDFVWCALWLAEKKSLIYSKHEFWMNDDKKITPIITKQTSHHKPKEIKDIKIEIDNSLCR